MRIFKRGRIWYAQFYDGAGKRFTVSTKCRDRAAAETAARGYERNAAGADYAASQATLDAAIDDMISDCMARAAEGKLSDDTVTFYTARAGHLVRAQRTSVDGGAESVLPAPLRLLTARHVDLYIDMRRRESVTPSTISKELTVLRMVLKLAKRRDKWAGDIEKVMPTNYSAEYTPRERWLTMDELPRLLGEFTRSRGDKRRWFNEVAGDRAARIAFMVATSARLGESDRAEPGDIDLAAGFVRLRGTKTDASARWVPIVAPWQRELLEVALARAAGKLGRLFRPWEKSVNDLRKACARVGIAPVSANDLRRTYTHWMRADGVPAELIGPSMGHVDTRMVERIYGKQSREELAARMTAARLGTEAPVFHSKETQMHSPQDLGIDRCPTLEQNCLFYSSDCRTRTCDPVINSHGATTWNRWANESLCSTGEQDQMSGLRRAVRALGLWDAAEATLEHLGATQ